MALLEPGARLMRRLRLAGKLALVAAAALLPCLVVGASAAAGVAVPWIAAAARWLWSCCCTC